jgi:hypothetical protein
LLEKGDWGNPGDGQETALESYGRIGIPELTLAKASDFSEYESGLSPSLRLHLFFFLTKTSPTLLCTLQTSTLFTQPNVSYIPSFQQHIHSFKQHIHTHSKHSMMSHATPTIGGSEHAHGVGGKNYMFSFIHACMSFHYTSS